MSKNGNESPDNETSVAPGRVIPLIVTGLAALAAVATAMGNYERIYGFIFQSEPALIEIGFLERASVSSDIFVRPNWNDYAMSGFSNPLELPLVIRNSGGVSANNLKVRFIFPDPVGFYVSGDGEAINSGQMSDIAQITGYETVTEFTLSELSPSKVYSLLDESLAISFRLRERVGFPFFYSDVAMIAPMWMDFRHSNSPTSNTLPIDYVVSMDGAEDASGRINILIEDSYYDEIQSISRGMTITLQLSDDFVSPVVGEPVRTIEKSILFYEGQFVELMEILAIEGLSARVQGINLTVQQHETAQDQWQSIKMANGDVTLLIDRGKNGSLDEVFVGVAVGEETEWVMMRPEVTAPFTSLEQILDLSKAAGIVEQAGQILIEASPNE